jgi:TetR/AcrR family transcriptional regulator
MTKRDSAATRQRILTVAEKLFAEKGFDGARVDDIAATAKVNKALIYYYFESKQDILNALFLIALEDVMRLIQDAYEDHHVDAHEAEAIFDALLETLSKKERILRIMMMEALKSDNDSPCLFEITRYFMEGEISPLVQSLKAQGQLTIPSWLDKNQMLVTEFFTGIMPMINFVVFRDQWSAFFGIPGEELKTRFFTAVKMTHMQYHLRFQNLSMDEDR